MAVAEGVGDHGCEYMTGGRVVILGPVGKNFAAGMSGGIAYVLDQDNTLYRKINKGMVNMVHVTSKYDILELQGMIEEHVKHTGSEIGQEILDHFEEYLPKFKKVIPFDYEKMLDLRASDGRERSKQRTGKDRSILCDQERKGIGGVNHGKSNRIFRL